MKKFTSIISAMALASAVVPLAANAEENDSLIYGTMNIPYADFYRAELAESANAYEVDAISSATTSKWFKNGEGELFEGTYNEANEDGTGKILGVTYPVALTQSDLNSLGSDNYGFTSIDYVPSAYKNVTVENGKAVFSSVQDETPGTASEASIKLSTNTPWGDYLIDIENGPELGAIYGALLKTTDGSSYAMCHEANIWRGELAWSSGIRTSEPHGNTLPYENFVGLMGSTISEVVFITSDGYTTIETDTYVPIKFAGDINIEDGISGTGKTSFTTNGFPDDYQKNYSVADNFTVTDADISYTNAMAGSYTLTISDNSGKYAEMTADFTLSSDSMPASYENGSLVKAESADESDFANFIKNISVVSVNGTEYSASGRGSVKIIGDDGKIDAEASSRNGKVFDGNGSYNVVVKSSGYNNALEFTFEIGGTSGNEPSSTSPDEKVTTTAKPDNSKTTTAKPNASKTTTTSKNVAAKTSESPKTGDLGAAVPISVMAVSAAAAFVLRKKKN